MKNPWKMTSALLAAALLVAVGALFTRAAHAEDKPPQPHMREALNALLTAQAELGSAAKDKGGFLPKARAELAMAINDTRAAIAAGK